MPFEMPKYKTAAKFKAEAVEAAKNLPTETKRTFWAAMTKEGKNLGEAREIAGIDDILVAAELVVQCHTRIDLPMNVEDIV